MIGITALLFLLQATAVNTGSHSLWAFATFIHGQTQFPEFSIVVMVDDLQVLYYDCNIKKWISRSQPSSTNVVEDFILEGANIVMEHVYNSMRNPAHRVNLLSNHTGGVHVHQRLGGCVLDNDKGSQVTMWEAYDGTAATRYNMQNRTINPLWPQLMWSTKEKEYWPMQYIHIYQPICIQTLKYYLEKEKNIVLRKERPRVRLIHKPCTETGEMKVSCLATGFYPRHINLTMLRDGHPIPDEELILGEVLPNGDGTYQTRRTLSIRSEELRERHHYTCSFTHLTLDNKLDINWVPEEGSDVAVIISLAVVLVLVLVFTIPVFVIYKRKCRVTL
ncbi:class I histocompatibility antigen, F10 alpha chain-like isoform X2 [Conger conger]|uniref:class I histocompatibility antigen, F10 alpha chain-like isoform X2 n=1 Tax=Conger conger TaxID=82655 RepID=UPI002A5AB5FF|nr:class I histocompatibility antigen, F10 alpha chain-like isoform X2 [Conger conger]